MNKRAPNRAMRRSNKARHAHTGRRLVADAKKRKAKKRQQTWLVCTLSGLTLALGIFFGGLILADHVISSRPAWWSPPDGADASTVALAERFERRVSDELSTVREEESTWELVLTEDEATSWFASRLPMWLEDEGVEWGLTGRPFDMDFRDDGSILVAMPVTGEWQRRNTRLVIAELRLSVNEGGGLHVRLEGVTLGRLPLPDDWAKGHLQAAAQRAALDPDLVHAVMTGSEALRDANIPIDANRLVLIDSIDVSADRMTLTCRTALRAHAAR